METKPYIQALRNKLLFTWVPFLRPAVYAFYSPESAPVFVMGNQKSGTSAVAALLARACGLSYDIDIGGFRVSEYAAIYADRDELPSLIRQRAAIEFSKGLVKEPNLTFLLPEMLRLYPRSRLAFVMRDPRANIRSTLNRLKIPGNLAQIRPGDYPELSPMWRAILFNEWIGEPDRDLNYVGRSAERWRIAAEHYQSAGEAAELIRYEDFRLAKKTVIEDLATRLGLTVKHDISPYVDVQYQPGGQRTTDFRSFFGPANLATIERECAAGMRIFNYQPTTEAI